MEVWQSKLKSDYWSEMSANWVTAGENCDKLTDSGVKACSRGGRRRKT